MSTTQDPSVRARILTAVCGLAGVAVLMTAFAMSPGPLPDTSAAAVIAFANQHGTAIRVGAWLQGIGSLLNVVFVLAVAHLAGARRGFAGRLTLLAGSTILMVSLLEITGYFLFAEAATHGDVPGALMAIDFIAAVQHVFLIAPALFLPFGVVLWSSHVLPRVFGLLTLVLGGLMQVLGLVGLFTPLQALVDNVLTVQLLWIGATAIAMAFTYPRASQSGFRTSVSRAMTHEPTSRVA